MTNDSGEHYHCNADQGTLRLREAEKLAQDHRVSRLYDQDLIPGLAGPVMVINFMCLCG